MKNMLLLIMILGALYFFTSANEPSRNRPHNAPKTQNIKEFTIPTTKTNTTISKELINSIKNNDLELVKDLVQQGADVNVRDNDSWTPLIRASWNDNLEIVKYLVENGADINAKNKEGNTALKWASYHGELEIVKLLVEHGADINIKNNRRRTALIEASTRTFFSNPRGLETIKYLVEHSADINAKDDEGNTALYWVSRFGNLEIVKLLVEHSADDIDVALKTASIHENLEIVKYLTKQGANINLKDNDAVTKYDIVFFKGNQQNRDYIWKIQKEMLKKGYVPHGLETSELIIYKKLPNIENEFIITNTKATINSFSIEDALSGIENAYNKGSKSTTTTAVMTIHFMGTLSPFLSETEGNRLTHRNERIYYKPGAIITKYIFELAFMRYILWNENFFSDIYFVRAPMNKFIPRTGVNEQTEKEFLSNITKYENDNNVEFISMHSEENIPYLYFMKLR